MQKVFMLDPTNLAQAPPLGGAISLALFQPCHEEDVCSR